MKSTIASGKDLLKYPEVVFSLKFIALISFFYYSNVFFIALTDSNGQLYSSFLHDYLDYIAWLRASILYVSSYIVNAFGVGVYISDIYTLRAPDGSGVIIGYTCLGYGVMSFWGAFILAQEDTWRNKVRWCLAGLSGIWLINCWRVAILLIALTQDWKVNKYIDHHDMFNIVVYTLILTLIYLYYKNSKPALKVNTNYNELIPYREN